MYGFFVLKNIHFLYVWLGIKYGKCNMEAGHAADAVGYAIIKEA